MDNIKVEWDENKNRINQKKHEISESYGKLIWQNCWIARFQKAQTQTNKMKF